jgi:hypothetical protein
MTGGPGVAGTGGGSGVEFVCLSCDGLVRSQGGEKEDVVKRFWLCGSMS